MFKAYFHFPLFTFTSIWIQESGLSKYVAFIFFLLFILVVLGVCYFNKSASWCLDFSLSLPLICFVFAWVFLNNQFAGCCQKSLSDLEYDFCLLRLHLSRFVRVLTDCYLIIRCVYLSGMINREKMVWYIKEAHVQTMTSDL